MGELRGNVISFLPLPLPLPLAMPRVLFRARLFPCRISSQSFTPYFAKYVT
jgi:hypothetical protein